jgi:FixJ family two-component response regulator
MLNGMAKRPMRSHEAHVGATQPLVSVVDDDESVRESLPHLLKLLGFAAKAFASANEFLSSGDVAATHCLLLDIAMPDVSGPQMQRELTRRGRAIPIIFITARADYGFRQQLLEQGAVECLFKPFSEQQLRSALDAALSAT